MPYNPSTGNYSLPAIYIAIPGTVIIASQHNVPLEDIATALNQVLLLSGIKAMTGPLDMGNEKIENVGTPTDDTDAARFQDVPGSASFLANKNNVNQTDPATSAKVTFENVVYNNGDYYDEEESEWTPPAGEYFISLQAGRMIGTGARTIKIQLLKNGVLEREGSEYSDQDNLYVYASINTSVTANGTDKFSVFSPNPGLASTDLSGLIDSVWFSGFRLS